MKCPECGKELMLVGGFTFRWNVRSIEPSPDYMTYTCITEGCSMYHKALVYDIKQQKWKT